MSSPQTERVSRLSPFSIPGSPPRLRGPSPIREKLDRFVGRVRSLSSSSSEYTLSNAIFNVGTTSAAIGGGEHFKTTYEDDRKLSKESGRPSNDKSTKFVEHSNGVSTTPARPRLTSADGPSRSLSYSVRSSVTTISYDSFHTARDVDSDDQLVASESRSASSIGSAPRHSVMFMRQLSAYIARDDPDGAEPEELFIRETSPAVDNDGESQDSDSTFTTNSASAHAIQTPTDTVEDEPQLRNVLDIAAYRDDIDTPVVQMRALLDTGNTGHNIMSESVAVCTGRPIEPPTPEYAEPPVVGNGQQMELIGIIKVRWYFREVLSTSKSYDVVFQVVRGTVPFDVALSFRFLQEEHVFRMASHFAMTINPGSSIYAGASSQAQRHAQAQRDKERREREKEARRAAEARRRAEQLAARRR